MQLTTVIGALERPDDLPTVISDASRVST